MDTKVPQGVAALLAVGATVGAHAVDLSTISTSNILFVSGSTAIDNTIIQRFINTTDGLCGGSIDVYSDTNTGVKFVAVACLSGSRATAFGISLNTPIAVIKEDNADSVNGIAPVNANTAIPFPTVTSVNATNCGAASPHICGGGVTATNRAPNFGYSDVEAKLFGASTANLNVNASVDQVFGIGASLGFYHALQNLQGLTADDNIVHVPSLHRPQLYSMLQGVLPPSILVNTAGTTDASVTTELFGTNTNANSFCGHATTPCATADANNLYLCLRGQSSGTMQISQVYFSRAGCSGSAGFFAAPTHPSCAADGCGWVTATFQSDPSFVGASTGDVLTCLQAHDAAGQFAIGIVGTDNFWGANQPIAARRDWRFIRLDGVMPSIENAAADKYEYWARSVSYAPKAGRPNSAAGVAGGLASVAAQIGSVGTVVAVNTAFQNTAPAFDAGFLAISGVGSNTPNPSNVSQATFRTNPVNSQSKGTASSTNNCQVPNLDLLAPDFANDAVWAVP